MSDVHIPEFENIGLSLGSHLTRGTLVTGSSGSGKTLSCVIPILRALASTHQRAHTKGVTNSMGAAAILVIDPKKELRSALTAIRHGSVPLPIHDLDRPASAPLDFFDGPDRATITAGEITDRLLSLCLAGAMHHDGFWREQARLKLKDCIDLDLSLVRSKATLKGGRLAQSAFWRELRVSMRSQSRVPATWLHALQSTKPPLRRYMALLSLLPQTARGAENSPLGRAARPPAEVLVECVQRHLRGQEFSELSALATLAPETATSILATLTAMIGTLLDSRVSGRVSFDPVPAARQSCRFSMADAIRTGTIMIHQPADSGAEASVIGRAMKISFFRAMMSGAALASNRLGAYVADEAQRWVHAGGETSYFDVARSFNGVNVICCQSLSALRTAFQGDGDEVRALISNLSTRFCFASSHPLDTQELFAIVPPPSSPHLPHLLTVRPLASLTPGEVLWLTPGRFGIGQIRLREP